MVLSEILNSVSDVSILVIVLAFVVSIITVSFGSLIFKYIGVGFKKKISFRESFKINYLALFVGYLVPFKPGSLALKVVITKFVSGVDLKYSTLIMIAENVFYFLWQIPLVIALLFMSGFAFMNFSNGGFISLVVFIILLIIFMLKPEVVLILRKIIPRRILNKRFENFLDSIRDSPKTFLHIKILVPLVIFSLISASISPFFVKLAEGVVTNQLSYLQVFIIFWISYIIGRISIFSDGLGVKDITMGALLVSYGIASVDAIKIVILFRVFTALPVFVIGGAFAALMSKKIPFRELIKRPK